MSAGATLAPNLSVNLQNKISASLQLLERSIKAFGTERSFCAFNGGKDATLTATLFCIAHRRLSNNEIPKLVFFERSHEFPEIVDFVSTFSKRVGVELRTIGGFKSGIQSLHDELMEKPRKGEKVDWSELVEYTSKGGKKLDKNNVTYFFALGERRSDNLDTTKGEMMSSVMPTDGDFPDFLRVHPLLEYDYGDIWNALEALGSGYCELYDKGFSSLGLEGKTSRNKHLCPTERQGTFIKASELPRELWGTERQGRLV